MLRPTTLRAGRGETAVGCDGWRLNAKVEILRPHQEKPLYKWNFSRLVELRIRLEVRIGRSLRGGSVSPRHGGRERGCSEWEVYCWLPLPTGVNGGVEGSVTANSKLEFESEKPGRADGVKCRLTSEIWLSQLGRGWRW